MSGGPPPDEARVQTSDGWLQGVVAADHRSFQAIPYAAPPVGPLRWRSPQPAKPWQGVRDATRPGQRCTQSNFQGGVTGGEDCLFLNVTTPLGARKGLPVLVFVHGGGLVTGAGDAWNPRRMVQHDAIVVTLNYRLGAFGFLKHPSLDDPYAGNFGLADQQFALRWVRDNIAAFGGDARNVTLWGQSAGGVSVCSQLASPGARGLFSKAIAQSAPCGNAVLDPATAVERGLAFASFAGCSTEACLRGLPASQLVRHSDRAETFQVHRYATGKTWMPVAGTRALPLQPLTALQLGLAADVPLLHGGTKHEVRAHVTFSGQPVDYPKVIKGMFGKEASRILSAYPAGSNPGLTLATALTDYGAMVGACTQLPALKAASRGAPAYGYEFAEPAVRQFEGWPPSATHGADMDFLLDLMPTSFTPGQKAFADRLIGHWVAFAKNGDPGWPVYQGGIVQSLAAAQTGPIDLAREHRCGFWQTIR
ncbi:carboxylesterase family protein [Kibdelosporangium philippinense]|uniref:Carboxylic ester hydrolase n=2 Tax=Kibdelosporangium philippinense TaxID=211113 RepID=A0ABS8Z059_9PSEU|nr:carboxylesterase family protein [Kibdelosporangium philippinense]